MVGMSNFMVSQKYKLIVNSEIYHQNKLGSSSWKPAKKVEAISYAFSSYFSFCVIHGLLSLHISFLLVIQLVLV